MPLSDKSAANAKPAVKPYRLFDGKGLYLEVAPSASKYWRVKYRFAGKEKRLALGVYPEVSLKRARERCEDARRLLQGGVDPGEQKRLARVARTEVGASSFEVLALEWLEKQKPIWAATHWTKIGAMLKRDLFPWCKPACNSDQANGVTGVQN